jgi:hypothetical protein
MASFLPLTQGTEESDANTVGHRCTAHVEEPRSTPQKFPVLAAAVALICGAAAASITIMGQTSYKGQRAAPAIASSDLSPSLLELGSESAATSGKPVNANSDSGFAVCLTGFQGAQNVSGALRKFVIDPLQADLFVVSPESRASLQAFEPFEGDVGRDVDVDQYFDNLTDSLNDWRKVTHQIGGNWFYPGAHQAINLMQCNDLIKVAEASRGQRYKGIVLSRLDFMWLQPHPVPEQNVGCWIPCPGNDNGGICDHHASCDRNSAEAYMTGKVKSITDPQLQALIPRKVHKPKHKKHNQKHKKHKIPKLSSEQFLKFILDHFQVPLNRSAVAAFRSCVPGSKYAHDCKYVAAINMWAKDSGSELKTCMQIQQTALRMSESAEAAPGEMERGVQISAAKEAQQEDMAPRQTAALFYGDSILRYAVSDFCEFSKSETWASLGDIEQMPIAGPRICNVTDNSTLILEFMQYGFGYELPLTHGYETCRHPLLPPSSKESLEIIHKTITELGIKVDAFFLESNLWDVQRWMDDFTNVPWEVYTKDWAANATEMIQLVEKLFPEAQHMWISTCVSFKDNRKTLSELLNKVAQTVVPDSWTYLDTESILGHKLYYRDKYHLRAQSTLPLVSHLLGLVTEANTPPSLANK